MPFVFDLFYSNRLHLKMNYEGESSRTSTDEQEPLKQLLAICRKTRHLFVCKWKGGLTLHTRAKHGKETAVLKSVSPMTPDVVREIFCRSAQSIITSKFYQTVVTYFRLP